MRRPSGSCGKQKSIPCINAQLAPAKTYIDSAGVTREGRSIYEHCLIVGFVAKEIIKNFPAAIVDALFPSGSALVAACHDVGKLSPVFYLRLQIALNRASLPMVQELLAILGCDVYEPSLREFEQQWGGHAGVSAITLAAITKDTHISAIVGQHHGRKVFIERYPAHSQVLGSEIWQRERTALVLSLQQAMHEPWPEIKSFAQRQLLSGLTTVADWIGSGRGFDNPDIPWRQQIPPALNAAGIRPVTYRSGLEFGDIFQDEAGRPYQPNEIQRAFSEAVKVPGVYVLEAPMGMGKTEAALYAAGNLLAAGHARGVYFALPTQLTSDKIYQRFSLWLQTILSPDNELRYALLLHGKSHLQNQMMGEDAKPGGSWFDSRKRGLLAPFAVGTLDQALMAVMNVKHGFVRAFGLAGKVVIFDEVHSYDAYTSLILTHLIHMLRELQCTVIILSATLTQKQRAVLLATEHCGSEAYPLISAMPFSSRQLTSLPLTPPPSRRVMLHYSSTELAIEEALRRAEQGQQVLWIENTVAEAQECFATLASRCKAMGLECGLLHSRFTLHHRTLNEERWVSLYGKGGWQERTASGRVLIGTQVLEQSIDIDADFLVTRFAPTDLLMQRLGRLWRHERTPRPACARREVWLLAPETKLAISSPYLAFGASAWVYAPYILCRTLEVWRSRHHVDLPTDIRPLLEATYRERPETEPMSFWLHELLEGKKTHPVRKGIVELEQHARLTLSSNSVTQPESRARTRYSEQDNASFLLLREATRDTRNKLTRVRLLNGDWHDIPWQKQRLEEAEWRELALELEKQRVSLPHRQRPEDNADNGLWEYGLKHVFYPGNRAEGEEPELQVVIVEEAGDLRGVDGAFLMGRYRYRYQQETGLRIMKKE
ncbi:CRISPR-associated helicase Cas3' [Franconibacter pulveris 1160]|uniref:CRISPR-associated helicase Cas3' n=1 Tax=Franconibacter pulveris TaxID=435910 RepID=UPI0004A37AA3|nr:CRISPR-associated helicase Cas3' [Franconibacter pulveris]